LSTLAERLRSTLAAHPLAAIVVAGLVVRIALMPLWAHLPNGTTDEGFWTHWMEFIHRDGVLNVFRTTDTDYVGYHWVLWALSLVYEGMGGSYESKGLPLHLLVKVPSIIFDVVLMLTAYWATATLVRHSGKTATPALRRAPLIAAAVVAFQPAVLYDGAVWAQTDSAITAAMLGSVVLAAQRRPFASGAVLALGLAVKPHPIMIAPVLAIMLWRSGGARALLRASAGALVVAVVVLGPWILHGEAYRIAEVYQTLFTKHRERLSELAWNVWWVFDQRGNPRPENEIFDGIALSFQRAGFLLGALAAGLATVHTWRRPGLAGGSVSAAYIMFAFYELPVGAHERYLYPFLGLLLPFVLVTIAWRWRYLYIALSVTFFLNLVVVAPPIHALMDRNVYGDFGVFISLVNTGLFIACTVMIALELRRPAGPIVAANQAQRAGCT